MTLCGTLRGGASCGGYVWPAWSVKWFLDHLTDTGRAGVIVPNGVLFGTGKVERKVRELLLTSYELQAVITLPWGVFKPYSGVGTWYRQGIDDLCMACCKRAGN